MAVRSPRTVDSLHFIYFGSEGFVEFLSDVKAVNTLLFWKDAEEYTALFGDGADAPPMPMDSDLLSERPGFHPVCLDDDAVNDDEFDGTPGLHSDLEKEVGHDTAGVLLDGIGAHGAHGVTVALPMSPMGPMGPMA